MKTGLLTFYHIHHYGAMLQAYATERAVASLGSECEIIDYYVNQDNTLFQRPTGLGSAAHDAHTALHYGPLKARYERFEAFSRENLNISGRRYQSLEELRQAELPYDVLLSGSDQIWNPKIFPDGRFDPVFFGAFSHKRKIAYSPSFGIPRIPDGMEEELRGYLESFSHLSVRERQGQAIVRDIIGQDVPVVLDPTLLLTQADWASVARDGGAGQGYILCYCISRPGALAPYIRRLAEETGLPVVQLCGVRQKVHPKARCILSAGPAEFLGLFRDAAYVCTNSFHGTVFSVQFQKPFFTCVAPAEMAVPESSRTFSLLSRLGLGDRIIGKGDTAELTLLESSVVYFNGLNGLPSEQWNVQHTFRLQRITGDRWRIASHDSDDNPYYSADYDPVTDTDRHLPQLLACIEARESGPRELWTPPVTWDHDYDRAAALANRLTCPVTAGSLHKGVYLCLR